MREYLKHLKPIEPSNWGLDFDIKNLKSQISWIENRISRLNPNSKQHRDLKRQINEKVWYILLLELNNERKPN